MISYALYDSRYLTNPDRAICYTVADTLKEARHDKKNSFEDAIIVKQVLREIKMNRFEVISSTIIK